MRSLLPNSNDLRLFLSLVLLGGCGGGDGIILPGDGQPAEIAVLHGDEQQGTVGEPLNEPVVVQVTDTRGRPVEGATVAFEVTSAGSEVVPPEKSTDADGLADARLVLGTTTGRQTGRAHVVTQEGRPPVQANFSAIALSENANRMAAVAGQDQTGHVGQPLDDRLVVEVTDGFGNPVAGVPISWAAAGGGSVSEAVVPTDEDGRSRVERTLGPAVGQQTTVASSEGLSGSPATFLHTALAGDASRLVVVSGSGQTAAAGSALPADLVVRLVDSEGNGVPRTAVSWVVATGGGNANPETSTTDEEGRASSGWTLGQVLGEQRLDAVVSGVGVASFHATASAGAPASLFIRTQPSSTAQNGVQFGRQPVIQVRDSRGNDVSVTGIQVRASLSGGGELQGTLVRGTGADGRATFTDLAISGDGGKRTLFFTAEGYAGVTSNEIDVGPPPANRAPIANFNWFCEGLTCAFTDSSRDPDGGIVSRVWDFGDGTPPSGELTLTPSHTYATAATYPVSLTVTDDGGLSAVSNDDVRAQPQTLRIRRDPSGSADMGVPFERQPELQLRVGGRDLGRPGVVITASIASGSGTLGGSSTATTDDQGSGVFTDLSISGAAGPHTLRFTASEFGEVVSSTIEVRRATSTTTITGDSPDPSVAETEFTVSFQVTGAGPTPTGSVTVTVSGGSPTCTAELSGGAGSCPLMLNNAGDRMLTATYSGDGFYGGSSGQQNHRVNAPPTARFDAPPCVTNLPCQFDGSGSSDSEGPIATYTWDFSDPPTGSEALVSHTFATAGNYLVTLTVTDNDGATASVAKSVTVNDPIPPAVPTLNLRTPPATTVTSGALLGTEPEVELLFSTGGEIRQQGVLISVAIAGDAATLGGSTTRGTDDRGRATFDDLSITGLPGSNVTLVFTAPGYTQVGSQPILIQ